MTELVATVGGYVCCLMLALAGVMHAWHAQEFRSVVRQQQVAPSGLVGVVTLIIVALELTLAGGGLIAIGVLHSEAAARLMLLTIAALFLVYAAYTAYLVAQRGDVPCGCSGADLPVGRTVVVRAAGLSVTALVAATTAGHVLVPVRR